MKSPDGRWSNSNVIEMIYRAEILLIVDNE